MPMGLSSINLSLNEYSIQKSGVAENSTRRLLQEHSYAYSNFEEKPENVSVMNYKCHALLQVSL